MIYYPNAKINIGLRIVGKRDDGYHNISSFMLPIQFSDILEIKESDEFEISYSGLELNSSDEYINRLYKWLYSESLVPPMKIHLQKVIPVGSGLGGGSSDLAFFTNHVLKGILDNKIRLSIERKALEISTDSFFFLRNRCALVSGKGDEIHEFNPSLEKYYLLLVIPEIPTSTSSAYDSLNRLEELPFRSSDFQKDVRLWTNNISNAFESFYSTKNESYTRSKSVLYKKGADFVSLSGSGSSYFGLFKERVEFIPEIETDTIHWFRYEKDLFRRLDE